MGVELQPIITIIVPSGAEIEKVIKENHRIKYGTNGDSQTVENKIEGAKEIIRWMMENHLK